MRGRRIPYQIIGKHIRQCLGTFLKKRSEHETVGGSYLKGGASDNSDRINTDFTRGPYSVRHMTGNEQVKMFLIKLCTKLLFIV